MHPHGLRTWIEIDTKTLAHNYSIFRKLIGKEVKLMAVAKSNAYGHSLIDYSIAMEKLGADALAVDSITEALALRKSGIQLPTLILGYTLPEKYIDAITHDIIVTISNFDAIQAAIRAAKKSSQILKVHIKIDTGFHRQGFFFHEIDKLIPLIKKNSRYIKIEGIYTHFAGTKNPSFPQDTLAQISLFEKALSKMHSADFSHITRHASASYGTIAFPQARYDMVRVGLAMFGLWPSKELEAAYGETITLKPALSWHTLIGEIKTVPKGGRIGYDFTESVSKDTRIAICPVGYWHGYPRALSSIGKVAVKNKITRILGRVSMDMIAIDISYIPQAKIGERVTLIGPLNPAPLIADLASTSSYEFLTRINPLIKRLYK